jgi:hypothetical protein
MNRRTLTTWVLVAACAVALDATGAEAQERGRPSQSTPAGHLPPPGACRVWYDGRPPGHQPPPTSCGAARREAYRTGGRVIDGGGERRDERYDDGRHGRDGRYPVGPYPVDRRYPETLPEISWGVIFGRGDRLAVAGARGWLGGGDVRPLYTDADRDGRPEVVSWYDARGAIVQLWIDDNHDGRADRVAIHRNGRVVRVIR